MGGRGTIPRTDDEEIDEETGELKGDAEFPIRQGGGKEYYRLSSGHKMLHRIKTPFLALNASDDPIVAKIPYDDIIMRSEYVVQVVTPFGGHLGWFEGGWNGKGNGKTGKRVKNQDGSKAPPERWVRGAVLEWLQATGEDLLAEEFEGLPTSSSIPTSTTIHEKTALPSPALSPVTSSHSLSPYPSSSSSSTTSKRSRARPAIRVTREPPTSTSSSKPQEWIFEQGRSGTGQKGDCKPGDEVGYMFLVRAEHKVYVKEKEKKDENVLPPTGQAAVVKMAGAGPNAASSPVAA